MKYFAIATFLLFSAVSFSEDIVDVTGRLTLEEAKNFGAKVKIESGRFRIEYKVNFQEFEKCTPEYVDAQAFDSNGNVQLSARLENVDGWHQFSIGLKDKDKNRINIVCKSGDRNLYFIAL